MLRPSRLPTDHPLRSRSFRLLWLGQSVSTLGDQAFQIALAWLVLRLTGSPAAMSAILIVTYVPTIALLMVGGVAADRIDRATIARIADVVRLLLTSGLGLLVLMRRITWLELLGFAAGLGTANAFFGPALSALRPTLVDPDQYAAANATWSLGTETAALLGPAVGGLLVLRLGMSAAIGLDAATFLVSLVSLARTPSAPPSPVRRALGSDLRASLAFLVQTPAMVVTVAAFSLTNALNDVEAVLVPFLVRDVLHLTAAAYGTAASCLGVGTLLGALLSGRLTWLTRHRRSAIFGSLALFGLAIAAMGLAHNPTQLFLSYVLAGVGFMVGEIQSGSLWQHWIPDGLRGRVLSAMGTLSMAMNPLGFALAGFLGTAVGIRAGLVLGGTGVLLVALLAGSLPVMAALNSPTRSPTP